MLRERLAPPDRKRREHEIVSEHLRHGDGHVVRAAERVFPVRGEVEDHRERQRHEVRGAVLQLRDRRAREQLQKDRQAVKMRRGVEQREALKQKAKDGVHNVSMSATPIPRSLANTLYGEGTEIVNIHTMPAGRKPVKTIIWSNENSCYKSVYNQIKEGHQCYVVCPLIEDSDSESLEGVDSVETTYKKLTEWFKPYPEVKIKAISGDMKAKEVQEGIEAFAQKQADILISTTIVEVGVNVPNATVIVIKNAERFGLAQLHQLRGRVGRSSLQSYCVLLSKDKENERLKTMEATNDGFKIAEKDLELRGTGQILGVKQSGKDAVMEMALNYPQLYQAVRKQAEIQYKIDHPMG